jgi:hypothetical protein
MKNCALKLVNEIILPSKYFNSLYVIIRGNAHQLDILDRTSGALRDFLNELNSVGVQGLLQPSVGGANYFQAPALDRVRACFSASI